MLFSGLTPAVFISLGNAVARCCNLSRVFWFINWALRQRQRARLRPKSQSQDATRTFSSSFPHAT
jgi:hypothetical protein